MKGKPEGKTGGIACLMGRQPVSKKEKLETTSR
jgi:hypothetical protein